MQSLLCFLQDFATLVVLSWEPFCSLGDIWPCLQTFLVVAVIGGERPEMTLNTLLCTGQPPTKANRLAPNINTVAVEKL